MNMQNDLAGDVLRPDIKPMIAKARDALVAANKSLAAARHQLQAGGPFFQRGTQEKIKAHPSQLLFPGAPFN
jgi:hypothetical protein